MSTTVGQTLGLKEKQLDSFASGEKVSLPFSALLQFQRQSGLSLKLIGEVIDLPKSTMRTRRARKKLNRHESDRLIRLGRLFARAVDLHEGNHKAATRWLQHPCQALGNHTPLQYASTELGAREVESVIGRLEHGVFT